MKIYRPGDAIAPLVTNLQTTDDGADLGPWFIGLGLIGFGVSMWVPGSPFAEPMSGLDGFSAHMVPLGFGLALVLVGISFVSRRVPALARFGSRHRLAIIIGGITAILMTFGPVALLAFVPGARPIGIIFMIGLAIAFVAIPLWLVQRRNAARIAAGMRSAPAAAAVPLTHDASAAPANPGDLVIALYEVDDLPIAGPFRDHLTADSNIVGQPPCRFLYLYNFFADAIRVQTRPTAGWRLHGPVSMLASPLDLARAAGYRLDAAPSIESQFLTDPAMIEARVAAMSDAPLPRMPTQPVSRWSWLTRHWNRWTSRWTWWKRESVAALPKLFADVGAYPEDVLLCTDATWNAGVTALTARAHKVIVDAFDFSAARLGLVWEIQHVLNHFATEDLVVLVNSFTDLPALGAELRRAWARMAVTSPNNRRNKACVRIVLLTGDDHGAFDDDSSVGARDAAIRDPERIDAHARIVTLLRSAPAALSST
jgi:hypothetical protein